jgi:UDP-glucose 4-epimerase
VDDVVEAALAAAESQVSGALNIGTGVETSVLELIERLRALGGAASFEPELAPPRPGEVQRITIDPGRAAVELRWAARTDLPEGLRLTLESV